MLALLRMSALALFAVAGLGFHRIRETLTGRSEPRARALLAAWCRRALPLLRVSSRRVGAPPPGPCIYVSNHRSYLDILVLSAHLGGRATFLSRHDVADWPVVGRAARDTGVVFVDRDDPQSRARAARELERRLGHDGLIVFPEGTTTGDSLPGRFEAGIFRLLHAAGVPIVPVTLRYSRRDAYWVDDAGVGAHLRAHVLCGPRLRVEVRLGVPIAAGDHAHAAALRRAVHAAVSQPIVESGEGIEPF